ncbi:MAG: S53 family peptidase [Ktedonobacteraceae bacterium]
MRKFTASILVLLAFLAVCATAFSCLGSGGPAKAALVDDFSHNKVKHPLHVRTYSPNSLSGGLTPSQFRKAYGIDLLAKNGAGITVAIVEAYGNPNAQVDLNKYDKTYGLPATTITTVYPQGKVGSVDEGWALETDLDVQMVHALAPRAKIILEVAKTPTDVDLYNAVKDAYTKHGATVVSMSFGGSESAGQTGAIGDGVFSAGNAKGVSFTASSGDGGTGAQYPAASPYVTSVGGTTLNVKADGTYVSETAWSGSGGGLSAYEKSPAYQVGFNKSAKRGLPDVAMVADPNTGVNVFDSFGYNGQKGFFVLGGTSVAAPMFAGVLALVNQGRSSTLKNADIQIYAAAKANYKTYFHDITSGNNGSCGKICNASSGYDYVTGLGSPIVNTLVPALIAAAHK